MHAEVELLLLLCRIPVGHQRSERAGALIEKGIDWDNFFAAAASHELEAVTMTNLRSITTAQVPPSIRARAEKTAREARAIALGRTLMMNDMLSRFDSAGVSVLVMKGPAVGVIAYGDPSLRTFADLDLLIRESDLVTAKDVLHACKYLADYDLAKERMLIEAGHALEFVNNRAKVELHSSLLSRYLRLRFDIGDVWSTSVTVDCVGRPIRVMSPSTIFVFLCAHGAKHEWMRLRWICDIAQLAGSLTDDDWIRVVALADRLHARRLIAIALELISAAFGDEFFHKVERSTGLKRDRAIAQGVLSRLGVRYDTPSPNSFYPRLHAGLPALLFWLASRERLSDRLGTIVDVMRGAASAEGRNPARRMLMVARLATRAIRSRQSTA